MLFLPPSLAGSDSGPILGQVEFVRYEAANLAWGIERLVEGPMGRVVADTRGSGARRPLDRGSERNQPVAEIVNVAAGLEPTGRFAVAPSDGDDVDEALDSREVAGVARVERES